MNRLHVSAATGHHQANTECTRGLAKCVLSGIPFRLQQNNKIFQFFKDTIWTKIIKLGFHRLVDI